MLRGPAAPARNICPQTAVDARCAVAVPNRGSILRDDPCDAFSLCSRRPPKPSATSGFPFLMSPTTRTSSQLGSTDAHTLSGVWRNVGALVGPIHSVVILHGLPGAGKSTLAAILVREAGFASVSFDTFWATSDVAPPQATEAQRDAVYREGLEAVYRCARTSNVVVDCTSRAAAFRAMALLQLWARNCHVMFLSCDLDPYVARERVILRLVLQANHLGRGAAHFDAIAPTFEPFTEFECQRVARVVVDTGGPQPQVRDLLAMKSNPRDQYIYEAIQAAVRRASRALSMKQECASAPLPLARRADEGYSASAPGAPAFVRRLIFGPFTSKGP